ncbi:MAG TPA: hypothetical protein VK934_13315 [Fimbriimonas sp.]|nr:hypothetical protein [Fimbriimonas sp.]
MSKLLALFIGGAAGALAGWITLSGQMDSAATTKAGIIGVVSGLVFFLAVIAWDKISQARSQANDLANALEKGAKPPLVVQLESDARARPNSRELPERLARKLTDSISQQVTGARSVAAAAVYIGLAGTLLGLTFAVYGLRGLRTDAEQLKDQILAVVSGFGGSFTCALCGIVVTVALSWRLARFDDDLARLEALAEDFVDGICSQAAATNEERIAKAVAKGIADTLEERLTSIWLPLNQFAERINEAGSSISSAAVTLHNASERIEQQTIATAKAAKDLESAANNSREASVSSEASAKALASLSTSIKPTLIKIDDSLEMIAGAIQALQPALQSTKTLETTVERADAAVSTLHGSVEGIAAALRDEVRVAAKQGTAEIIAQQKSLKDQIDPALEELRRAVELLGLQLDRTEQMARNLPMSVPATRFVEDLKASGAGHLAAAERDGEVAKAAADRLIETERKIHQAIEGIRNAHANFEATVAVLKAKAQDVSGNMEGITEYLEMPVWKRLAGRRK